MLGVISSCCVTINHWWNRRDPEIILLIVLVIFKQGEDDRLMTIQDGDGVVFLLTLSCEDNEDPLAKMILNDVTVTDILEVLTSETAGTGKASNHDRCQWFLHEVLLSRNG